MTLYFDGDPIHMIQESYIANKKWIYAYTANDKELKCSSKMVGSLSKLRDLEL